MLKSLTEQEADELLKKIRMEITLADAFPEESSQRLEALQRLASLFLLLDFSMVMGGSLPNLWKGN